MENGRCKMIKNIEITKILNIIKVTDLLGIGITFNYQILRI